MNLKLSNKIYIFLRRGLLGKILKRLMRSIRKSIGGTKLYDNTFGRLIYRISHFPYKKVVNEGCDCWNYSIKTEESPLVSIVVPCYNHAEFLRKRLDTIYNQTYSNYEVILLDDHSTDGSQDIIKEYAERYPIKTKVCFNTKNGGRPFLQWKKGINMSMGELVWIAESDDWCELNYLEEMVKPFYDTSVMISFCNYINVLDEERRNHFINSPDTYSKTAALLTKEKFSYACILCNVSGTVFRRPDVIPEEIVEICSNIKVASDWLFYLWISKGGCVTHVANTTDYHRIHENGTSYNYSGTNNYFYEHEKVARYIANNYVTTHEWIKNFSEIHYVQYKINKKYLDINFNIDIEELQKLRSTRKPNIAIACFSLQIGGGETFPIHMANALYSRGYTVTIIDFNLGYYEEEVRRLLLRGIPLVRLKDISELGLVLKQLHCDIIHSHHAIVDRLISDLFIQTEPNCKHIITLHGMYETQPDYILKELLKKTGETCSKYVYLADKNLIPFKNLGYYSKDKFTKIGNGLPVNKPNEIERAQFSIDKDDFVLCIASRGIREKGWEEAIKAVVRINSYSKRKVHLFILGDGEMKNILEVKAPDYIHFMGARNDARSFFLMADAGVLPSYFKGESYPLMIIECLQSNTPIIATAIAEIPNMILDDQGNSAGLLVPIKDLKVDEYALEHTIFELVSNEALYSQLKANCNTVRKKFDMNEIMDKYLQVYYDAYSKIYDNKEG